MEEIKIGDKFIKKYKFGRNTRKDICTVVDLHTTKNLNNNIVKKTWIAEYWFFNQIMRIEVADATIMMNKIKD